MNLKHLRYLIDVTEAGSINRAAERLGLAQSALSRHMAQLEADLGTPVLQRSPTGVSLTPAGRQALTTAHTVLREIDRLRRAVATRDHAVQRVRLGMPPTVTGLFRTVLERTVRHGTTLLQPSVVEGSSYWLTERLAAGDLDAAIVTQPARSRGWRVAPLWVETLCLVGPLNSPFAGCPPCRVADLADLPLTLTPLPDNSRHVIEQGFRDQGLRPNVVQEHEALNLLKEQIRFGAHSILPRIQARQLAPDHYIQIPITDLAIRRGLVSQPRTLPPPLAATLLTALLTHARQTLHDDPWIQLETHPGAAPKPGTDPHYSAL